MTMMMTTRGVSFRRRAMSSSITSTRCVYTTVQQCHLLPKITICTKRCIFPIVHTQKQEKHTRIVHRLQQQYNQRLYQSTETSATSRKASNSSTTYSKEHLEVLEYYRKQDEGIVEKIIHFIRTRILHQQSKTVEYFTNEQMQQQQQNIRQRNINMAWYMFAVAFGTLGASYASVPLYKVFCQTTGFGGTTNRILTENDVTTDQQKQNQIQNNEYEINDTDSFVLRIGSYVEQYFGKIISSSNILSAQTSTRVHTWTVSDAAAKLAALRPVANAELITITMDTTVSAALPWSFKPIHRKVSIVPGETALTFFRVTNHSNKAITGVATYNVNPPQVGLYFQKIQCFCFEQQRLLPGETVDMPVFFFIDPEILNDPNIYFIKDIDLSYTFFQTDEDYDFPSTNDDDDDDDNDNNDNKKGTDKKK